MVKFCITARMLWLKRQLEDYRFCRLAICRRVGQISGTPDTENTKVSLPPYPPVITPKNWKYNIKTRLYVGVFLYLI